MPTIVTRKKLHPTTIFDLNMELYEIWSDLKYMIDNKKINEATVEHCMEKIAKSAKRLEIQVPRRMKAVFEIKK